MGALATSRNSEQALNLREVLSVTRRTAIDQMTTWCVATRESEWR